MIPAPRLKLEFSLVHAIYLYLTLMIILLKVKLLIPRWLISSYYNAVSLFVYIEVIVVALVHFNFLNKPCLKGHKFNFKVHRLMKSTLLSKFVVNLV